MMTIGRSKHLRSSRLAVRLATLSCIVCLAISLPVHGVSPPDDGVPPIIVIPNVRIPAEGIVAGGQPTEEALKSAAGYGYSTIVDLRGEGEDRGFDEKALVESLGMRYVSIPISGASDLTEEHARELSAALQVGNSEGGMTMVHCASGNRVGALLALESHYVEGTEAAEAFEFGVAAGMTGLADAVRGLLGLPPDATEPERSEEVQGSPSGVAPNDDSHE